MRRRHFAGIGDHGGKLTFLVCPRSGLPVAPAADPGSTGLVRNTFAVVGCLGLVPRFWQGFLCVGIGDKSNERKTIELPHYANLCSFQDRVRGRLGSHNTRPSWCKEFSIYVRLTLLPR